MTGNITRRGKTSWRLKYELPRDPKTGKRRSALKTVRGSRKDAEKELRAILTAQDNGIVIDPNKITVAEYMADWLENTAPRTVSPKTLERYRGLVRNQIRPHLGNALLQTLKPADISRWIDLLANEGKLSTASIRHAHGVLRTALNHAAAIEIVSRNVAAIIKPPALKRREVLILTSDQVVETLAKLKDHPSLYTIAVLAVGTGARRGEIAALRWSDLNLDSSTNRTVRIERALEQTAEGIRIKRPKTPSGLRTVSLPEATVNALREHKLKTLERRIALGLGPLSDDTPVFANIDGDLPNPYSITDRWRDAVKNRGLPKVTFHALRHTHASALISKGLDVVSISKRMGHASPSMTLNVYGHLFDHDDSKAAAAIDAVLGN